MTVVLFAAVSEPAPALSYSIPPALLTRADDEYGDVRFWHLADMSKDAFNVRFRG